MGQTEPAAQKLLQTFYGRVRETEVVTVRTLEALLRLSQAASAEASDSRALAAGSAAVAPATPPVGGGEDWAEAWHEALGAEGLSPPKGLTPQRAAKPTRRAQRSPT